MSPMIRPVDGPTEGRHVKTRRKTRKEKEGRDRAEKTKTRPAFLCPGGGQGQHERPKQRRAETKDKKTMATKQNKIGK